VQSLYRGAVDRRWFRGALIVFFVAVSLGHLGTAVGTFVQGGEQLRVGNSIYLGSSVVSGLLVLTGLVQLRLSRLRALVLLRTAILVSIFVSQVFLFYENELAATGGLAVDLITYLALSTGIRIEQESDLEGAPTGG
jgi:hypothetical protein